MLMTVVEDAKGRRELVNYDKFRAWMVKIKQYFAIVKYEENSIPLLPEEWLQGNKILNEATQEERELICSALITFFVESLRHWRVDREKVYGKERKKHLDFMKTCTEILKMKDGPISFPI
jgi:hypothetical protein